MNQADARRVADELEKLGYRPAARAEDGDVIVLNTCVVRQSAEDKVVGRLSSLKPLKARRPGTTLALMGCFVGDIPALRERFPYVDLFLRPSEVAPLIDHLRRRDGTQPTPHAPRPTPQAPVSVYVPISYGCDHHCTYCIVRLRRGAERSRPLAEVLAEVRDAVTRGAREVTLLGQNVDSWGRDLPGQPDLADLLEAVHGVEGLWRIRFLTSHPADMSQRLIETIARLPRVCEHIEIPVQSGDDEVLRRMGRGYTVTRYRDLIARIRAAMPGVSLATDVIVGFPGESEAQFMGTYRLLEEVRFDVVHVAAYSPRPGTPAARLPDDVPPDEKQRRRKAVEALQTQIAGDVNRRLVGQTVDVLVEELHRGKWKGRTRTNKLVFFESADDWRGQMAPVRITWAGPWSMQGVLSPG